MLVGLLVQLGALALLDDLALVARVLGYVAGASLVYGGTLYARGRGYSPWVGFGAFLSFLGVGILLMLPTHPRGKRIFGLIAARVPDADNGKRDATA